MTRTPSSSERRNDQLSRERIVEAAIEILDAEGERALTFRALASKLSTGAGALYWHIADKAELLTAATDHVVKRALASVDEQQDPHAVIRANALAMFDAFDSHPWVGASLSLDPRQSAMISFLERIGGSLIALAVPEEARFDAWSACVNYILGVAGQNAAHARGQKHAANRDTTLRAVADSWASLDPALYPFLHDAAAYFPQHDDRAQFLAGIELILAGINLTRSS